MEVYRFLKSQVKFSQIEMNITVCTKYASFLFMIIGHPSYDVRINHMISKRKLFWLENQASLINGK